MSVPAPMKSVWVPSMNDGSQDDRIDRSTTTWNDPLAASYLLRDEIDFSTTGWLRSTVVSANGLRNCGSNRTADSTSTTATMTATATAIPTILPTRPLPREASVI